MGLNSDNTMWMIRAGEKGYLVDDFKEKSVVALTWNFLGDLAELDMKRELVSLIKGKHPGVSANTIGKWRAIVERFYCKIKVGDPVISYNQTERVYLVGEVLSDYEYNSEPLKDFHNIRRVKWYGQVLRDDLSVKARNSLGSLLALFIVPKAVKLEILELLEGKRNEAPEDSILQDDNDDEESTLDSIEFIKEDIEERAKEFIKDRIFSLNPYDMQDLFAGVLRAMGYKTRVSPKGPDRGVDILASPDGLGLENPRIIVQVKHRKEKTSSEDMRAFNYILKQGDKGIYLSTGGFSKDAYYEADRSPIPVKRVDIDDLVELVIQYYDAFDSDTRALVPLRRIYWPV